ncbi:MAG: ABC transporter permease [Puniceicoccales bacterium]|jgi:lipoprotein-releasing system permease protein|nr:ABC transporter permease [Puniceicoccales bacterium]
MKWYTYLAIKQLFPTGKRVSFFTAISVLGVALGVMVLFVVQSVMDGFQRNIRQAIVGTQGDLRVDSKSPIMDGDDVDTFLKSLPEVAATAKYSYGIAMMQRDKRPAFPIIKGIDLENELRVVDLQKFIKCGTLENFDSGGVILSGELARWMRANVGDSVEIYSPKMMENEDGDEVILPKTLEVAAIFETGYHHADQNIALLPLDVMQELYGLNGWIHGIGIKLKPNVRAEKFAFELNKCLNPPILAESWQEMNRDLLFALKTEKTMMFFVLLFILLMAAFSIAGSLTISVVRKTREIGLIGALGGTAKQCAACFMVQGLVLGIVGSAIGIPLGMAVIRFRNDIVSAFVKLCRVEDFMLKFYAFSNMPAQYGARDIFVIVAFAIALCCIAGILPALKAAKINPAEALRNE